MSREADAATKVFLSDKSVARDVINLALPNLLGPDQDLRVTNPEEIALLFDEKASSKKGRLTAIDRLRDLLVRGVLLSGDKEDFAIIGFENQTYVDLAMPLRVMLLNTIDYVRQAARFVRKHRNEARARKAQRSGGDSNSSNNGDDTDEERRPMNTKEFLSGLREGDKLKPVITIVINWSTEPWTGPRTLQEMIDMPEGYADIVDNNRLIILEPAALTDEQLAACETDLRLVLKYLRTGNDKDKLAQMLANDPDYENIDVVAAHVIAAVTGTPVQLPEKSEKGDKVNMIKAVADMIQDGKQDGMSEMNAAWLRAIEDSGLSLRRRQSDVSAEPAEMISDVVSAAGDAREAQTNARWARALLKQGQSIETIAQMMGMSTRVVEQWLSESDETD